MTHLRSQQQFGTVPPDMEQNVEVICPAFSAAPEIAGKYELAIAHAMHKTFGLAGRIPAPQDKFNRNKKSGAKGGKSTQKKASGETYTDRMEALRQRRQKIIKMEGKFTRRDLTLRLNICTTTAGRDLNEMTAQGLLTKTRPKRQHEPIWYEVRK